MIHVNEVTVQYVDKENRTGRLLVNGFMAPIYFINVVKSDGFNYKVEYQSTLANDFNMSNPIHFQAATVKGLVGKVTRHQYKLVKF